MTLQEVIDKYTDYIMAGKLDPDMPVFMLLAQDKATARTVRLWASISDAPEERVLSAYEIANDMDMWPEKRTAGTT